MSFKLRDDLIRRGKNGFHYYLEIPVDFDTPVVPGDNDYDAKEAVMAHLKLAGINGGLDWRTRRVMVDQNDEEVLHTPNPKCFRIYYRVNVT